MKYPKDPVDATIVAFLWADWFVKQCLTIPFSLYMKFDHWNFNRTLDKRNLELYNKTPKP